MSECYGGVTLESGLNFPIRAGNLTVLLAASPEEIAATQSLRCRVFYEEMDANPSLEMQLLRSDFDSFAWKKLPPLIKGHLRIGGFVGDGAVVDSQFNTTDVSIIVKTNLITKKYFRHYERSANRPPR